VNDHILDNWIRINHDKTPLYIRPDLPDWFVPNQAADQLIADSLETDQTSDIVETLLKRIDGPAASSYSFRSEKLTLNSLKECWIHITNTCNMQCPHCIFGSSPAALEGLSENECARIIEDAYGLGCRIFFFTGGEPFVSKHFFKHVQAILQKPDTHIVVLTNLALISGVKKSLRSVPNDRLHFQVSIDGLETSHDTLRGPGAFADLMNNLQFLRDLDFPATLSMTATKKNVAEMAGIVDVAQAYNISSIHFLWLFMKGKADAALFIEPSEIFPNLTTAQQKAEEFGIKIDNVEVIRSQVFSCPGTKYDLSNAGWQSLAIGPDGNIYPSPALVYTDAMKCGHISEGLENVWRKSTVLEQLRAVSLQSSELYRDNPFRYLVGGGDVDHSYIHSGKLTGGDPYIELYNKIAGWLMTKEAEKYYTNGYPAIMLKMGEKLGECPIEGSSIFFTHSNCVLTLPGNDTHTLINRFYSEAAVNTRDDILNPICYEDELIRHIPEKMRFRSYGCGSPVVESGIRKGETVVDLGSGTGIECFIAGKLTGPDGRVVGIDMGETMLGVANKARTSVIENLNYDNIEFREAFLESLPLEDDSVDVVISNCVVNLSPDKRRVFSEIFRVLKPGGRLVISDITYDTEIPLDIKYNEKLRGECIGGALRYQNLFGLLNDIGFSNSQMLSGYNYRTVKGYDFYSITYRSHKPLKDTAPVLNNLPSFSEQFALVATEPSCSCAAAPEQQEADNDGGGCDCSDTPQIRKRAEAHESGCMACGADLVYLATDQTIDCFYCKQSKPSNAMCTNGHFICDTCHGADAVNIIKEICLNSSEPDAVALMKMIRSHRNFRIHGPEHHSMVPAIILTALRNSGENISDDQVLTGIQRGQSIAGGACAFFGACGAAIGVGIAFSILLGANPLRGDKRQMALKTTQKVLGKIAAYDAPRCCQRDCWLALQQASILLKEMFGKDMQVGQPIPCDQFSQNKECIRERCPLWPAQ